MQIATSYYCVFSFIFNFYILLMKILSIASLYFAYSMVIFIVVFLIISMISVIIALASYTALLTILFLQLILLINFLQLLQIRIIPFYIFLVYFCIFLHKSNIVMASVVSGALYFHLLKAILPSSLFLFILLVIFQYPPIQFSFTDV